MFDERQCYTSRMSEPEILATFICFGLAVLGWGHLFLRGNWVKPMVRRGGMGGFGCLSFIGVFVINIVVLRTLAASDVRGDGRYIVLYLLMSLAAATFTMVALRMFGLRTADIAERGNRAAPILVFCSLIAGGFAFAGANIGDGPGFHVVIASAMLSYGAIFALALAHTGACRTMYRILVDRDRGTAFRFGCLLIACGIVLGRAVAGTWVDAGTTLSDFLMFGWPAAVLVMSDIMVARATLAREPNGNLLVDRAIGLLHIALACLYVSMLEVPK